METAGQINNSSIWKLSMPGWAAILGVIALLLVIYDDGIKALISVWNSSEEYGYGYIIPVIVLFLIWQKKNQLQSVPFSGSWLGLGVVLLGLGLFFLGELSTLYVIIHYSIVVALTGLVLAFAGWRGLQLMAAPLVLLVFMIPLPAFLYQQLSAQLQLISSQLGVGLIRLFDISVLLEGNVIDLGTFKLQVAEACSGLRYLFPLTTLAFIAAYFFKGALWKRVVIFLSAIPITILMNSFRIGVIGVIVAYWGPAMAEGFLHDFEGWAVFMACTGILVLEMWVLAKIGSAGRPLSEVFGVDFPAPAPPGAQSRYRSVPRPFLAVAMVMVPVAVMSAALPKRHELQPARQEFAGFPMQLDGWQGKRYPLESIYIEVLKFEDYILADFMDGNRHRVNFYAAYYASQRKGESAHSPRSCIPGGGWEIVSITQRNIDGVTIRRQPLRVNRTVIQKGEDKQLVYYWFQQRGRVMTNEYLVKWYLFWDALTRNRTDGALVRLTALVIDGQELEEVDRQLSSFAHAVTTELGSYIPE